ncbi:MAG TPA: hypothetical protein VGH19_23945 [Verrucomicrobiae bacterium]
MNMTKEKLPTFGYGTNGDEFKPLAEVLLSDVRQTYWVKIRADGSTHGLQLEDFHQQMSDLNLNPDVPEDVCTGFDTARNLYLYSWFAYRFQTVAELQACATLELALGKRIESECTKKVKNLGPRLLFAFEKGWLKSDQIRVYQRSSENRKRHTSLFDEVLQQDNELQTSTPAWEEEKHAAEYLEKLIEAIPSLRNVVAHGNPMLHGGSVTVLEICCDLINQLFPQKIESQGK